MDNHHKIIIVTAPSGAGKTTIVRYLLQHNETLTFSVSATTRAARKGEEDGVDYYFITPSEFKQKIVQGAFAEYEMVYKNKYYGTLHEKLNEIWESGRVPLIDIDVKGAKRLKDVFKQDALSIFIQPPDFDTLKSRLRSRGTETPEMLQERLARAELEMTYQPSFDATVINKHLQAACKEAEEIVTEFLKT